MCPSDRKGANKLCLFAVEGVAVGEGSREGATRARLVGGAMTVD